MSGQLRLTKTTRLTSMITSLLSRNTFLPEDGGRLGFVMLSDHISYETHPKVKTRVVCI